jgi:hypothetical protein
MDTQNSQNMIGKPIRADSKANIQILTSSGSMSNPPYALRMS